MPSTLVHLALGALVGVAVLGDRVTPRTLAVVLVAAAIPDLDTFVGLVLPGAHRSLLHTLLLPGLLSGALLYDTRWRRAGSVLQRSVPGGERLAWAALAALAFGGIFPDLFTNGVNAFYPVHDAFYTVDGKLLLSNQRGIVQTFVELASEETERATSETRHYSTGVDPTAGKEKRNVERVFPVVRGGWQLMLVLTSAVVVSARLWENRQRQDGAGK